MSRPVARYTPSRRYLSLAIVGMAGALVSGWVALRWAPAFIAVGLFILTAAGILALALRPAIEIYETHPRIGHRTIDWHAIRRLDQTGWNAPLGVHLTLAGGQRFLLVYTGDLDSCTSLLRHLRRYSSEALLDGIPYRQVWGEPPAAERKQLPAPRYRLLLPEDEEEVERLFQRLKSVGRPDQRNSDEN